jgi:hypothetical protein
MDEGSVLWWSSFSLSFFLIFFMNNKQGEYLTAYPLFIYFWFFMKFIHNLIITNLIILFSMSNLSRLSLAIHLKRERSNNFGLGHEADKGCPIIIVGPRGQNNCPTRQLGEV